VASQNIDALRCHPLVHTADCLRTKKVDRYPRMDDQFLLPFLRAREDKTDDVRYYTSTLSQPVWLSFPLRCSGPQVPQRVYIVLV